MKPDEIRLLAQTEERYWWHRGRQRIIRRLLDRYVDQEARVLDIGCGPGGTTLAYAGGRSILGTDTSLESLRLARERDLTVAAMDATRLGLRPGSFDAVVALDVLEHVHNDDAVLRAAHSVLRPGGVLLVTVPAYQFLWSEHDDAVGHLRRYTRGPLVRSIRECGFQVALASYAMTSILPAAMAMRLAERLRPRAAQPQARFTPLPRVANTILERVIGLGPTPLRFVSMPFGLSIVVVARRRPNPADSEATPRG